MPKGIVRSRFFIYWVPASLIFLVISDALSGLTFNKKTGLFVKVEERIKSLDFEQEQHFNQLL